MLEIIELIIKSIKLIVIFQAGGGGVHPTIAESTGESEELWIVELYFKVLKGKSEEQWTKLNLIWKFYWFPMALNKYEPPTTRSSWILWNFILVEIWENFEEQESQP